MTISWYVQQQFVAAATPEGEAIVRLPVHCVAFDSMAGSPDWRATLQMRPSAKLSPTKPPTSRGRRRPNVWSEEEHERFLLGLELFPQGPWKEIAAVVGTRSTRQTMTHAQKYRHKINRRMKWVAVLQNMVPTVQSPSGSSVSRCSTHGDMEDLDGILHETDVPARVDSPLEVSCETFDAMLYDADFQDLLDSLDGGMPIPMSGFSANL